MSFPQTPFPSPDGTTFPAFWSFAPVNAKMHPSQAWRLFSRVCPLPAPLEGGDYGISQVPREPHYAFALLLDPGRIATTKPIQWHDIAPAVLTTKAPTTIIVSRLNNTAFVLAVYASCRHYCRLRKTRFWPAANRYQVGLITHWVPLRGF